MANSKRNSIDMKVHKCAILAYLYSKSPHSAQFSGMQIEEYKILLYTVYPFDHKVLLWTAVTDKKLMATWQW